MDMMGNKQRRVLNIKAVLKRNWLLMSTIVSVVLGTCKPLLTAVWLLFSICSLLQRCCAFAGLAQQGVHAFSFDVQTGGCFTVGTSICLCLRQT